jgi:hypothetical protein
LPGDDAPQIATSGTPNVHEQSYLWHVAVLIWEIVRLTRHKTLAIERRFRQRLASEADRTKLTAEGKPRAAPHPR